jgi:hypothetical protein
VGAIKEFGVRTVLDVPCGDMNWQAEAREVDELDGFAGLDLVRDVYVQNADRFWYHSNKVFAPWDFALCKLPSLRWANESGEVLPFDLVHVRTGYSHGGVI